MALESEFDFEFNLDVAFEFKSEFEIALEFEIDIEFEFEFEFACALEFESKELTFGPISIPTGVQLALKDPLERSPKPPHLPTGECAQRHPGKRPKKTTLGNK